MSTKDSGSEDLLLENYSDDSTLELEQLNDLEYDIPAVNPPSLESILWDLDSENDSTSEESTSVHSFQTRKSKLQSLLYHSILNGITTQITSAGERVKAGSPTSIASSSYNVAVGMSHGYVLCFDNEQSLCWCHYDAENIDQGGISALAFNLDSTRILIGYERGYISMIDGKNGDVIRKLPDAHAPQSAVLHLRFTYLNNLALCGDSAGCVFVLTFNRRLGVKMWNSKCLFSGARGEVCVFEPLIYARDVYFLHNYAVVALATLSKIIIVLIRPRLKVLYTQVLPRGGANLPLLAWHTVPIGHTYCPVLAWGRGTSLNYAKLIISPPYNKIRLSPLRSVQLPYKLLAIYWFSVRHLGLMDTSENLHLTDVRNQNELEVSDLSKVGLVFASGHFKALALGGGVSAAFGLVGEMACYNSFTSRGDQLLVLGMKTVHLIKLRTWSERLQFLSEKGRWTEALNLLAINNTVHKNDPNTAHDIVDVIMRKYLESLNRNVVDKASLTAAVNCCVKLDKMNFLCNDILDAVWNDRTNQDLYYTLISEHIMSGFLKTSLHPSVVQNLVEYLAGNDLQTLENVILNLDIACLDLDQVLRICKRCKLYNAWIHLTTKAISDYCSPLTELLLDLKPDNHRLGNIMLVYVSSCLTGLGYPNGCISDTQAAHVKYDILRCLETVHSVSGGGTNELPYPYLRALLHYNIRDCLNVIELAFNEVEFSGQTGWLQRHRLIEILIQIVVPAQFLQWEVVHLACFIVRLLCSNKLQPSAELVQTVLERLTFSGEYQSENTLSIRDNTERQQAWLDLITNEKIPEAHMDMKSSTNQLKQIELAKMSKSLRVLEYLYEAQKCYENIFDCYMQDVVRLPDIFPYIQKYITNPERCIEPQILLHLINLTRADPQKLTEIVCDHFPHLIEECCRKLESNDQFVYYQFLNGINLYGGKLNWSLRKQYLRLLCEYNSKAVKSYVEQQLGNETSEINSDDTNSIINEMLCITSETNNAVEASALLLEKSGEWENALDMLLSKEKLENSLELCVRASDCLDNQQIIGLWTKVLKYSSENGSVNRRKILRAAAPHVPPQILLKLVDNVHFRDVKVLLIEMFADYQHDIQTLSVILRILSTDLHKDFRQKLAIGQRGIPVGGAPCYLCGQSLIGRKVIGTDRKITVFGCQHAFHSDCLKDDVSCAQCGLKIVHLTSSSSKTTSGSKKHIKGDFMFENKMGLRPDLEGHF